MKIIEVSKFYPLMRSGEAFYALLWKGSSFNLYTEPHITPISLICLWRSKERAQKFLESHLACPLYVIAELKEEMIDGIIGGTPHHLRENIKVAIKDYYCKD